MKITLTFFAFALLFALCSVFLSFKTEVSKLEDEIALLEQNIEEDKMTIHVLNAEWAHLNEPERIRYLAKKHIGLKEISAEQVKGYDAFHVNKQATFKKVSY